MNRASRLSDLTQARSKNTLTSNESRPSSRTILPAITVGEQNTDGRLDRYLVCSSHQTFSEDDVTLFLTSMGTICQANSFAQ
jgi:hypothetical protein